MKPCVRNLWLIYILLFFSKFRNYSIRWVRNPLDLRARNYWCVRGWAQRKTLENAALVQWTWHINIVGLLSVYKIVKDVMKPVSKVCYKYKRNGYNLRKMWVLERPNVNTTTYGLHVLTNSSWSYGPEKWVTALSFKTKKLKQKLINKNNKLTFL